MHAVQLLQPVAPKAGVAVHVLLFDHRRPCCLARARPSTLRHLPPHLKYRLTASASAVPQAAPQRSSAAATGTAVGRRSLRRDRGHPDHCPTSAPRVEAPAAPAAACPCQGQHKLRSPSVDYQSRLSNPSTPGQHIGYQSRLTSCLARRQMHEQFTVRSVSELH